MPKDRSARARAPRSMGPPPTVIDRTPRRTPEPAASVPICSAMVGTHMVQRTPASAIRRSATARSHFPVRTSGPRSRRER
ncbi:hypothetical protein SANTM175S_10735 [Streptomyces antimycoticus]